MYRNCTRVSALSTSLRVESLNVNFKSGPDWADDDHDDDYDEWKKLDTLINPSVDRVLSLPYSRM